MRDLWQMARDLDANALTDEQRARGERYIPIDAIEVRYDILPRSEQTADRETVDRYIEAFDHLPGIQLQADTLVLIDGLHRLEAAFSMEGRYHIRAVLRAVADADLYVEAAKANLAHGRPLALKERQAFAERLVRDPARADWALASIARLVGMHPHTISVMRKKAETAANKPAGNEGERVNSSRFAPEEPETAPRFDLDGDDPEPEPEPARPAPPSRPAAPPVAVDVHQLSLDFGKASALFGNYTPAFIIERQKPESVGKLVRRLETWQAWITEALEAARAKMGGV